MSCLAHAFLTQSSSPRRSAAGGRARGGGGSSVRTPLVGRLPPSSAPAVPVLRVVAGPDVLRFAVLEKGREIEIGRDPACALNLTDASVSRRHARVVFEKGVFKAQDLGSRNGTRINGKDLGPGVLQPGDRLEVGTVLLRLELVSLQEVAHLLGVVERLDASDRDPLTGLLTRAYLDEKLPALLLRAQRKGRLTSALFVDLDRFKRINDRFGHATGDDVLRQVARLLLLSVRAREVCVRYGGEELLVILEDTGEGKATQAAERLRSDIEGHDWPRLAAGLAVTISCGIAEHRGAEGVRSWLERADAALYAAKRGGRNRVVPASAVERPSERGGK